MIVKSSVVNTINDHIQFPVVTFSSRTQCIDVVKETGWLR
jgi:hypothetical protein